MWIDTDRGWLSESVRSRLDVERAWDVFGAVRVLIEPVFLPVWDRAGIERLNDDIGETRALEKIMKVHTVIHPLVSLTASPRVPENKVLYAAPQRSLTTGATWFSAHGLLDDHRDVVVVALALVGGIRTSLEVLEVVAACTMEVRYDDSLNPIVLKDPSDLGQEGPRRLSIEMFKQMWVVYDVNGAIRPRNTLAEVVGDDVIWQTREALPTRFVEDNRCQPSQGPVCR
jgi:hypothetical protein